MAGRLRLGTRGSGLALRQTAWVADALRARWLDLDIEVIPIRTSGDRLAEVSLSRVGGKGLFVKEIEEALLDSRIDVAVHSAKDLPMELAPGLVLVATSAREDPRDVLIARDGHGLHTLPMGARVGTGSLRRQAQLLHVRPDLRVTPLRGNLDTRLRKLEQEGLDAIVVAAAGVRRLGLEGRVTEWLGYELCLPAAGQGALGIEGRAGDEWVQELVAPLDHPPSAAAVAAERALVRRLGAGCHVSIAAYAEVTGETLTLQGAVLSPDGKTVLRDALRGLRDAPEAVGVALAERLLAQGAAQVLAESAAANPGAECLASPRGRLEVGRPLEGRKVLITRGWEEAGRLAELLADQGAVPVVFPTIALRPPASWTPLDRALEALGSYDWLVFTSANGVRFFLDRLTATGRDPAVLKEVRLAAIGPATARALEAHGLHAAFVPEEFRAEAVVEGLGRAGVAGRRVLLPRAREARDVLPRGLEALGAVVDVVEAYQTVRPESEVGPVRALLEAGEIAVVTFTSSSTVRNLVAILGAEAAPALVNRAAVACIGPITARTAAEHGIRTDIVPDRYTIPGLVEAIVAYHRAPGGSLAEPGG